MGPDGSMNVLQLVHNLKREGAQGVVANLSRALDPTQWSAAVHGWHALGAWADALRASGLEVSGPDRSAGLPKVLSGVATVRRIIGERRIDLVHAHMSDAAILAFAATRGSGVPYIVTHHSNRLAPAGGMLGGRLRGAIFRRAVRAAAMNVAVSDAVRVRLHDELGLPVGRTHHIGNGVEVPGEDEVSLARERLRVEGRRGGARIAMVGRLAPVKHHATLIEAMPRILAVRPDCRVEILGDGPLRDDLARHALRTGVGEAVRLPGSVDDVGRRLARSDLFVATSSYEGLPMALLEAMSWRLPVIASEVPGHRDTIGHGTNGLLVPFDDPEALARAVLDVLGDPRGAEALGRAARETVLTDYSSRSMARRYEEVYARCASAANGSEAR